MKRSEFLVKMQDAIRPDEAISEYTNLADIKQWDSLARTLVLVLFQKNIRISSGLRRNSRCKDD